MNREEYIPSIPPGMDASHRVEIKRLLRRIIDANRTIIIPELWERFDRLAAVMAFENVDRDRLKTLLPSIKRYWHETKSNIHQTANPSGGMILGPVTLAFDLELLVDLVEEELKPVTENVSAAA